MKTKTLFFVGMIMLSMPTFAKNEPMKPKELAPDWVHVQLPTRTNSTYFYQVFTIEDAANRTEAEDKAERMAYQAAAKNQGIYIDAATLSIAEMEKKIFLRQRCAYKEVKNDRNIYHFLYQISESGRTKPQYDDCDCNDTHLGKQKILERVKKSNARAITASTFIPGMGQMLKGQYGAGCGFLLGEIALFGGGTACYFLADKQNDIMIKRGTSYDDYNAAKNKKNTYNIAMYCCFGAGATLHIVNMCHAYMCFDKKLAKRLSAFEPAIIPINEYSQPNYALGISWHHNL